MNTKSKGDLAELVVASDLMKRGYKVAFPFGDNWKADLIVLDDKGLFGVQVKYTVSTPDVLTVRCTSVTKHIDGTVKHTGYSTDDIEWLAVYDARTERVFYIDSMLVSSVSLLSLRFTKPKNNQLEGIHWAENYTKI